MKKYLIAVALFLGIVAIAGADWIEPYGSSCKNNLYAGTITTDDLTISDDLTIYLIFGEILYKD